MSSTYFILYIWVCEVAAILSAPDMIFIKENIVVVYLDREGVMAAYIMKDT